MKAKKDIFAFVADISPETARRFTHVMLLVFG
jgi:hypothetical protein